MSDILEVLKVYVSNYLKQRLINKITKLEQKLKKARQKVVEYEN